MLVLAACGGTASTTAAAKTANPPPPPAPSASAGASSPPSPWDTWCGSQAFLDNEEAVGYAKATIADVNSSDYVTAAADGAKLEVAALKAGAELPPAGNGTKLRYGLYFAWLGVVGKDLAAGDVTAADGAAVHVVQFRPAVDSVDAKCKALGD
jgi:hypothetical protein